MRVSVPAKDVYFHKTIDLGALAEPTDLPSTCNNSLNKVSSITSISSAKHKSSILSSRDSPHKLSSNRIKTANASYVNISDLIRKKAHLYQDEGFVSNLDNVLESGYGVITKKKEAKALLQETENETRDNIELLEKEVLPEMNKFFSLKQELQCLKDTQGQYIKEIQFAEDENLREQSKFDERKLEIEELTLEFSSTIKDLLSINNHLKGEKSATKTIHKQQILEWQNIIKENKDHYEKAQEELRKVKAQYEKLQKTHTDNKRKMNNKSKMFLGIIKH